MASYWKTKSSNQCHKFRYLVVLDFEATCDEPRNVYPQEVIEFPAMIIDTQNKCILKNYFHFYVKPTLHPTLTAFCIKLTGITQSMVNSGQEMIDVIRRWNQFCHQNNLLPNDDNKPESCIVTCGDWDLKRLWPMQSQILKQNTLTDDICNIVLLNWLRYYTQRYDDHIMNTIKWYFCEDSVLNPALFHSWINIKHIYKETYGSKRGIGMMKMLRELGIKHVGRHHSGIDDVRNICNIVLHILNDGVSFDYTFINWNCNGIWNDIEMKQNVSKYLQFHNDQNYIQKSKITDKKIVDITLEFGRKNRLFTIIRGLNKFGFHNKKIIKKMKKQFGSGGGIRDSKYGGKEIFIQGDKRTNAKKFIMHTLNIDPQFVILEYV